MPHLKLSNQNKFSIRKNDELLVDLHFHVGRKKHLPSFLVNLSHAVDIVALTDRGNRFKNKFEHDFESFCSELKDYNIAYKILDESCIEIFINNTSLKILKAQEIFTKEQFDMLVIGMPTKLDDDIPYKELIGESKEYINILSTPFQIPNTMKLRKGNDSLTAEIGSQATCIEIYDQNLFYSRANKYALELTTKLNKPGIAASDLHLYSSNNYPLVMSGIVVPIKLIEENIGITVVQKLKHAILSKQFKTYQVFSPYLILEFLGLKRGEMRSLYTGA